MNKNKRDIVVLLVLATFLVNYVLYAYVVDKKLKKLKQLENKYYTLQESINNAIQLKSTQKQLEEEIKDLSIKVQEIDKLIPYSIDTPQLIYDFYNYCKRYNVIGDEIEFKLDEYSETTNETQVEENQQQINEGIKRLDIILNVYSSKEDLTMFLNNLDSITERKLNIKSISISQTTSSQTSEEEVTNVEENKFLGKLPIKIVFTQYIYFDQQPHKNINKYTYLDMKIGFKQIQDMFIEKPSAP